MIVTKTKYMRNPAEFIPSNQARWQVLDSEEKQQPAKNIENTRYDVMGYLRMRSVDPRKEIEK